MPINGNDLSAKQMTMILTPKTNEKQLFSYRHATILLSALCGNSKTGTNFACLTRMLSQQGPAQTHSKNNKKFKNMNLDYFWTSLKLDMAVNLSSSQNIVAGAAS